MRKIWLIIKREYLTRVKTKGFIIGTIIVPLIGLGSILLVVFLVGHTATQSLRMVIVDNSGALAPGIVRQLDGKLADGQPQFTVEQVVTRPASPDALQQELRARINAEKLDAYLWLPQNPADPAGALLTGIHRVRATHPFPPPHRAGRRPDLRNSPPRRPRWLHPTDEEIMNFLKLLFPAGADTTYLGLGNTLYGLLTHPEQAPVGLGDLDGEARWAAEEGLRWEAPVALLPRHNPNDVVWHGIPIAADTPLIFAIVAANRDPACFDDPTRFDVRRRPTDTSPSGSASTSASAPIWPAPSWRFP